jgi:hypothetical protein
MKILTGVFGVAFIGLGTVALTSRWYGSWVGRQLDKAIERGNATPASRRAWIRVQRMRAWLLILSGVLLLATSLSLR